MSGKPATENRVKVLRSISIDTCDPQEEENVFRILGFDPSFEIHFL